MESPRSKYEGDGAFWILVDGALVHHLFDRRKECSEANEFETERKDTIDFI